MVFSPRAFAFEDKYLIDNHFASDFQNYSKVNVKISPVWFPLFFWYNRPVRQSSEYRAKFRHMSSFKGRRLGFVDASENYHILYDNARRRINV